MSVLDTLLVWIVEKGKLFPSQGDKDRKLRYITQLAPAAVFGASLQAVYARYPEATKGKIVQNDDGSQELTWGGGLVRYQAVFGGGKCVLYRFRVLRQSRQSAEQEAQGTAKVLGIAEDTVPPKGEPEMISCANWKHGGFIVRSGVVRDKVLSGQDAFYADVCIVNSTLLESLLKK